LGNRPPPIQKGSGGGPPLFNSKSFSNHGFSHNKQTKQTKCLVTTDTTVLLQAAVAAAVATVVLITAVIRILLILLLVMQAAEDLIAVVIPEARVATMTADRQEVPLLLVLVLGPRMIVNLLLKSPKKPRIKQNRGRKRSPTRMATLC
jgi:hypothetical protein